MRLQQVQAQLGIAPPVAPTPQLEDEALCLVCM